MALSTRAQELSEPNAKFFFWEVLQNIWDPQTNPDGFVSLGIAENVLLHDNLSQHIHEHMALSSQSFTYGDGKKRLKTALARFLTRHFNPVLKIEPSHLTIANGCSSALEHTAWAFGNPGDVFILGKPYYGTFIPDFSLRMGTELVMVDFDGLDPLSLGATRMYDRAIQHAKANGKRVAGLILAHPHNPLGRSYSRKVLLELMKLCEKYQIHLISDEIYALSTFTNKIDHGVESTPFESVLSINTTNVINPTLVHAIWGISKDFGANGLRLGAIISQHNQALHQALIPPSLYSSSSSISDHVAANIFEDEPWTDDYIRRNRLKMAESYEHVVRWARRNNIEYSPGVNAAFFLWVNLGAVYQQNHSTHEDNVDKVVNDALLKHKVFLASGLQFGSEEPGWFRIVFTQKMDYLNEGLKRIAMAIK